MGWFVTGQPPAILSAPARIGHVGRCDELAGCNVQTSVDTIGIEVTYTYGWVTPLHSLLPTAGPGYTIVKSNAMRMEPVL